TWRHGAQAYVYRRQARTTSKLKRTTTRHNSPVLIFDELEYEPFTENRRWPTAVLKIARRRPPPTPPIPTARPPRRQWGSNRPARREGSCGSSGPRACARVRHNILN